MTDQTDVNPHSVERPGVPLGRPGDAREIAAVIAFLASRDAGYVTGASWVVDGGMLPMGPQAGSHADQRRVAQGVTASSRAWEHTPLISSAVLPLEE